MFADAVLPLLATAVSAAFAVLLLARYLNRGGAHHLVWSLSRVCYAIGVGADSLPRLSGWSGGLYRAFYLFGGLYVAAYLGMGTILLLCSPRLARTLLIWIVLASSYAALRTMSA